ncbi:MAG TPA: NUDIX hydrolase [Polyangiaceae bacterium]|jgi:ADP-ribose pyrophosphatase YjhB (NUDIX family)|nr:NUDIX hydrolase [Polyangiaceae bacterium]
MQRLAWVHRLQTITQAGLTYARDPYDRQRYEQLQELAAEIAASITPATADPWLEIIRAEKGYATPKVDVRAVVEREGKLLFMRESQDGLWALPGGWADIGESPSQIAEREVLEETGFDVKAVKLLALFDKARHEHPHEFWYCYKLFVRCELHGGAPTRSIETLDVAFFGPDELPPLSTPRVTEGQVRRMFEHIAHPELPTDFD